MKNRSVRSEKRKKRDRYIVAKEMVYPDRGGYTGFSICVWETNHRDPRSFHLASPWGSVEGSDNLKASKYILEGRFFVFGSLPSRVFISRNSLEEVQQISNELFSRWEPIMDELREKEKRLWKEDGRRGIHVSEMMDDEFINLVQNIESMFT